MQALVNGFDSRRQCNVLDVSEVAVKVQWVDDPDAVTEVPLEWWDGDAFSSSPQPQLHPVCECCGAMFDGEYCSKLSTDPVGAQNCLSCAALAYLAHGDMQQAQEHMHQALKTLTPKGHDLGKADSLCRHWASLRTALSLLDVHSFPRALSVAEVEAAQDVDMTSLETFSASWRRWLGSYLASDDDRAKGQRGITLAISHAKRLYGDGFSEEIGRRRAEESPAWRNHYNLIGSIAKRARGMEHVRHVAQQGKLTVERMEEILATRYQEMQSLNVKLAEHANTKEYKESLAAIEGYAQWFHGSGIAALQEKRQRLALHLAPIRGQFLENTAARWLEQDVSSRPPPESKGCVRKIVRNVCFRGVSLPEGLASEFDAFVVLCRQCAGCVHPPRQAGPCEGLWQVLAIERWVEVKNHPDEVLEAWCRHRDARVALAAWTGYISCNGGPNERFWFPAKVFEEFEEGVTFVTTPGCAAVVHHRSHVPRSLLTPPPVLLRLFQFALDRLPAHLAIDVKEPGAHWDYVEDLYRRSGEIFMHEGEEPENYRGYLQTASVQLRELVHRGQVLVVPDLFCACYSSCHINNG